MAVSQNGLLWPATTREHERRKWKERCLIAGSPIRGRFECGIKAPFAGMADANSSELDELVLVMKVKATRYRTRTRGVRVQYVTLGYILNVQYENALGWSARVRNVADEDLECVAQRDGDGETVLERDFRRYSMSLMLTSASGGKATTADISGSCLPTCFQKRRRFSRTKSHRHRDRCFVSKRISTGTVPVDQAETLPVSRAYLRRPAVSCEARQARSMNLYQSESDTYCTR